MIFYFLFTLDGVNREVFELRRDNESELGQAFGYTVEQKPSLSFINSKTKSIDMRAEKW